VNHNATSDLIKTTEVSMILLTHCYSTSSDEHVTYGFALQFCHQRTPRSAPLQSMVCTASSLVLVFQLSGSTSSNLNNLFHSSVCAIHYTFVKAHTKLAMLRGHNMQSGLNFYSSIPFYCNIQVVTRKSYNEIVLCSTIFWLLPVTT